MTTKGSKHRTPAERYNEQKRLHADLSDPRHGTVSCYTGWKCRCEPCREANKIACKAWAERKRREAL